MKVLAIALLLCCISPTIGKSQTSHHPARNNYIKLFKENVLMGEGILYDLTDTSFIVYDDDRVGKHDTIIDRSLLRTFSFREVQLVKINSGSGLGSLLLGGFIGGAAGSLAGYGIADVGSNEQPSMERSHDELIGFVIGSIIGGVAGAIPGFIHGNKQREEVVINFSYANFISERDNLRQFCLKK